MGQIGQQFGGKIPADFADIAIQKSIEIKDWGLKTYRCTKQIYNERTGKSSKTVDFQLEQKIEKVKETKSRYTKLLGMQIFWWFSRYIVPTQFCFISQFCFTAGEP